MIEYEKDVKKRGGLCDDMKITTIPMNVYRSKKVATTFNNKQQVLLAGDASSGVVFGRGVNKGLQEAVLCADSVNKYLSKTEEKNERTPNKENTPLIQYDAKQKRLFMKEKMTAQVKAAAIKVAKVSFLVLSNISVIFRPKTQTKTTPHVEGRKSLYL